MKKFCPFFMILLLFPQILWANLSLNIEIIHRKGMEKGLILVNEVHTVESFSQAQEKEILLGKEWIVSLKASFTDKKDQTGPSESVLIEGALFKKNKNQYQLFKEKTFYVELGKKVKYKVSHSSDQIIELSITPNIR